MNRRRYFRSSLRSRESSSSDVDPREKIKDYLRKFVAFMCSQVGVGALVVCYTIIGAVGFSRIESTYNNTMGDEVLKIRINYTEQLWVVANKNNVFNRTAFYLDASETLRGFQNEMVVFIKNGYHGGDSNSTWTFPTALMYSLSIITMIGYGNLVPKTPWGKFATVVYAVFGIPLYVLYFLNMGEILAGSFRWIYTWLYECSTKNNEKVHRRIVVPTTACLWVMGAYVLTGAIMFTKWEQWSFLDSTYFCVTSLCKLGFGDFVPGTASKDGNESKLVINFIYILVGLGLVAMCYNLMKEEVRVKVDEFREDFRQCLEDTRVRVLECCRRFRNCTRLGMSDEAKDEIPVRLLGVSGFEERKNDVLYCGPQEQNEAEGAVVYFGGDIQDFKENMEAHRDNKNYVKWSLDNTTKILQTAFPNSHIIVIRPSKMEYKTFSCFENFVPSGNCGIPHHVPMHHSLLHLEKLLENVGAEINTSLNDQDLTLVGFSKGCVVLNQFLYEFQTLKEKNKFVSTIRDMFWLDGGHSGGKNTWMTSKVLLEIFAAFGINIHIHVSPYQIQDDRRPWIRKEEKIFYNTLFNLKAPVHRRVHYPYLPPSIVQHFSILNEFHKHSSEDGT